MARTVDDDTEWHDALRKYGVIPKKPIEPEVEEEYVPTLNEIEKAETKTRSDDSLSDPEIEQLLDDYCSSRRADLAAMAISRSKESAIREVTRSDYVKEVAEASRIKPVLVLLYNQSQNSKKVEAALVEVGEEFCGKVDICKIQANECIPSYPDSNVPTLILYTEGNAKKNYVGIQQIHVSQKLTCAQNIIDELKRTLSF